MISSVTSSQNQIQLVAAHRARAGSTDDVATSAANDETRTGRLHGRPPGPPSEAIDSAAKLLGMTSSEVGDALKSGTTLKDLAASKGVSESDLLSAVTDGLKTGATKHGMQVDDDRISKLAATLVNGTPPTLGAASGATAGDATSHLRGIDGGTGRMMRHGGPPPGPPPAVTESVADLLDTGEADLLDQLNSGTSLKDIAANAGVSESDLANTIKEALASSAPDGVTPTDDELSDFANRIINSTSMRSIDGASSSGSSVRSAYKASTQPGDAESLSSSLKIDIAQLLDQLKSGTHVSDIAAAQGVSTEDLFGSLLTGLLADTKI